ncbi:hypothetical protein MKW94_002655 [Papaver nudicaule]|uniref:RING-type domain-containing protein n=1 Tax=Papaver nudicaule TaxID=74823 RepID=A0AA41RXV4_PAPNU|nr:hypothetical protein [Papaver nudicaule]
MEIANRCKYLLGLQRRGPKDLAFAVSVKDATLFNLHATLRTQGLVRIQPSSIRPSGETKTTASRDQANLVKHETLKRKSEGGESRKCPICLDVIKDEKDEKGTATLPNCSHLFHFHCIIRWLPKKQSCPLCRGRVSPYKRQRQ